MTLQSTIQYVSAGQAADLFDVSAETIRRKYREGLIPGYRVGRYLRFDPTELREAFRSTTAPPNPRVSSPNFAALDAT